jgi:hypothetical protein
MSKKSTLVALLVLMAATWGCSGVQVGQDYEPGSDFSKLKTFGWKTDVQPKTGDVRVDNPLLDERIRRAVEYELSTKGFRKATKNSPDFLAAYDYSIRQRVESSSVGIGTGFGIGSGGSFGGIGVSTPAGDAYDEGLLVIDFTDPKTGDLLWRGTGSKRVSRQSNPQQTTVDVNVAVEKVLSQFPPVPGQ